MQSNVRSPQLNTKNANVTNNVVVVAIADMPTFENQKEESLTTEARRADNRGPKGRYR